MKITDRRELEFSAESVVRAIAESSKAAQTFGLPGQAPQNVQFHPREGKVDVVYRTDSAPEAVPITAEALGALLISYCIRASIPMPRKSDKGIRVEANSIILAFKTTYDGALTLKGPPVRAKVWQR
jgi:hypothetical protein